MGGEREREAFAFRALSSRVSFTSNLVRAGADLLVDFQVGEADLALGGFCRCSLRGNDAGLKELVDGAAKRHVGEQRPRFELLVGQRVGVMARQPLLDGLAFKRVAVAGADGILHHLARAKKRKKKRKENKG